MAALGMAAQCAAQISIGGEPSEWTHPGLGRGMITTTDLGLLPEEEEYAVQGDFRYGTQRFHAMDVLATGRWDVLPGGGLVCRAALRCPGAVMLSVQFDQWELNPGDAVYLYDAARTRFIGGFDASNRAPDGGMATAVLPGDEVVIEFRTNGVHRRPAQLHVASVTHGFLDLFGFTADADEQRDYDPGYQSAPCHINVICPEASDWQQEKRSVGMFLRPDGNGCSGNLVNNTQSPRKPYFHLANHCLVPASLNQWVFYFNYESPTCVGSTGPTSQTITGATLRANYYYTDMALVELSSTPPANYNIYYAGWDRSGAVPQQSTVIQHPMYDVKKIAFNTDPSTTFTDPIGVPCWRQSWEQGLVQAVSSGSPLFDQNHRMVGHMYDGAQVCSTATSIPTDCAKFSAGWDGASAAVRMRDWLNPANNLNTLDGFDPNASSAVALRVRAFLDGPYNTITGSMSSDLRAGGLIPLTEPYTALGYTHVGGGGETTSNTVLNVSGSNAVVDWVLVELRSASNNAQVLATRSALLQADGDIVTASDGSSALSFGVSAGAYHIAVRHRNHLGIMTANAIALSGTAVTVDLSNGSTALFGGSSATKSVGGRELLYSGDVDGSGVLKYTGEGNDRDPILSLIGGSTPTATATGYHREDVNMNGVVSYVGNSNDRDPILVNVGGNDPSGTRAAQLP